MPGPWSESAWQRQRETPARNRKHLGLSVWTFPATAEHLLLPGLCPKLHFLSWASCLVPWWVPSRNQGVAFTPVGSANWAPSPARVSCQVTVSPTHDLPAAVLVPLERSPFLAPITLHLLFTTLSLGPY